MSEYKLLFDTFMDEELQVGYDWEAEKEYFKEFLDNAIKAYERRYNTMVRHICLAGTVGRWNGNFTGGRHLDYNDNPIEYMGNVDDITVHVNVDTKVIEILGHHHDATHCMNIYIISDSLYEKWDNKGNFDTPEFYEWLVKNRVPLRIPNKNRYYTV